ncbi:MAG: hypothetical protein AAB407_03430 [Patescibacteria group bacterium]
MSEVDPYDLDGTEYARILREENKDPLKDSVDEGPHPLLERDALVADLMDHLNEFEKDLNSRRYPEGRWRTDSYHEFDEGFLLRREILIAEVLRFIHEGSKTV